MIDSRTIIGAVHAIQQGIQAWQGYRRSGHSGGGARGGAMWWTVEVEDVERFFRDHPQAMRATLVLAALLDNGRADQLAGVAPKMAQLQLANPNALIFLSPE